MKLSARGRKEVARTKCGSHLVVLCEQIQKGRLEVLSRNTRYDSTFHLKGVLPVGCTLQQGRDFIERLAQDLDRRSQQLQATECGIPGQGAL